MNVRARSDIPQHPTVAQTADEIALALKPLLERRFGAGTEATGVCRLSGGAVQDIWSFDVTDGLHRICQLILRRNVPGVKALGGADMETEARVIALAAAAGAAVPAVLDVFTPDMGLGSGYLMSHVAGETLPRRILRDEEFASARAKLAYQLGMAAARIHAIEPKQACPLRIGGIAAELEYLRSLYHSLGQRRAVFDWALAWLEDHRPEEVAQLSVVHGDLRNGNIVVGSEGLRAILDWELVHLGDPMEDLGWLCVTSWRFGNIDLPVGGFGTREQLFAGYAEVAGHMPDPARVRYHEVLGTLRWGLGCLMMVRAFVEGDRTVERAAIGRRASETEIDLLAMLAPLRGMHHA